MTSCNKIDNIFGALTEKQRDLFDRNIEMWEKTSKLNGRSQSSDGFEVDSCMLMKEWEALIEDIYAIEFV